jgi:tetratricopeptide (TPR) repeat protein
MRKLIQLMTLSLVATLPLAATALAQTPTSTPTTTAAAPAQDDPDAKAALYNKVRENIKTNQPVAYEAAKEYIQKYPNDTDQIATYLRGFITKYEAGVRDQNCGKFITEKKWSEAFALCKQIANDKPDSLAYNLNTSWAGFQLALSGNNASNTEATSFSQKTIQLIESGKTLEEGKPYPDKDKQESLGWLNYSLGLYQMKNNQPNEAAASFIKAAGYESSAKNNPITYSQLANVYEGEYGRLQEEYDKKFKGQPETDESKSALTQVKNFLEPMIDAYARAVAYSGDNPSYQPIKAAARQRLEELYKFARGSADGMDALIASVKTKPLPPQPSAPVMPAAPATTTGTTMTDNGGASGTKASAMTPATTSTTTPTTTPSTTKPNTTTNPTPSTTTAKPATNGKPMSKAQAKTTTRKTGRK